MRWKDGSVFEGTWKNDLRVYGVLTLGDIQEAAYEGFFNAKDQYHGKGTIQYSKFRFTGEFVNHVPPFFGRLEVKDLKDIYYGEI